MIGICAFQPAVLAGPLEAEPAAIAGAPPADVERWFDIEAQPLQRALEHYGAVTGISLLYDSALTSGRAAPVVRGTMTPHMALLRLLEGSGLAPRYTGNDALVLLPVRPQAGPEANDTGATDLPAQRRYYGLIQRRIRDVFCANAILAQGRHRIALRLWVDVSGSIGTVRLLDSTGDAVLDRLVVSALQGAPVGEPVPAFVPQPFTLVVMPRASGQSWGCPAPATSVSVLSMGRRHGG